MRQKFGLGEGVHLQIVKKKNFSVCSKIMYTKINNVVINVVEASNFRSFFSM